MSSVDPALHEYKTLAWQHPAKVAYYAQQLAESVGANRLKNAVETAIIKRWVTGTDVIDVGIGTGRASIPLARDGKRVTGIDASAAMLERAQRDALPAQIAVAVGDIARLPVPDAAFDSLVSLNCAEHFPHWKQYLLEWKRVVRPGGRLIFDFPSRNHVDAVAALTGIPAATLMAPQSGDPATFLAFMDWRELAAFCDEHDLAIEAIVPHALYYSTWNVSFQLNEGLAFGEQLDRILSWLAVDDRFYEFGRFIHHELVGHLTPESTTYFFAVLRNAPDRGATARFAARTEALNALFARGPSFAELGAYLGLPAEDWRREAIRHLEYAPNLVFAALLMTAMPLSYVTPALVDDAFGPAHGARLRGLRQLHAMDRAVDRIGAEWYDPTVTYHGVPLGAIARYYVTNELFAPSAQLRAALLE
jgi:SAM-dependent methyltransferase